MGGGGYTALVDTLRKESVKLTGAGRRAGGGCGALCIPKYARRPTGWDRGKAGVEALFPYCCRCLAGLLQDSSKCVPPVNWVGKIGYNITVLHYFHIELFS